MTRYASPLTDDRLRRALSELAAGPDGSDLLIEVLRTIDSTAQVGRRPWDVRRYGRPMLVLAAVLVITAAIGFVVASLPRPQPQPTPTAPAALSGTISKSGFVVPFTYRRPDGETARLVPDRGFEPGVLYRTTSPIRRLEVFLVDGPVSCEGGGPFGGRHVIGTEPAAFLEDLRDTAGVGIGPVRDAMLGNLPALAADIDPAQNECTGITFPLPLAPFGRGDEPSLDNPGRIIVAQSSDTTIAALITSTEEDQLSEWLPVAQAYVDSFVFSTAEAQ